MMPAEGYLWRHYLQREWLPWLCKLLHMQRPKLCLVIMPYAGRNTNLAGTENASLQRLRKVCNVPARRRHSQAPSRTAGCQAPATNLPRTGYEEPGTAAPTRLESADNAADKPLSGGALQKKWELCVHKLLQRRSGRSRWRKR